MSKAIPNRSLTVLMAEDNEHDILATRRAWKRCGITHPLHVVKDGEACLDYLYRRGDYTDAASAPFPSVLILDLMMPKLNGLEVLERVRSDEQLKALPVIMLTTSELQDDELRSYNLGANAFLRKPMVFDEFVEMVRRIALLLDIAAFPPVARRTTGSA